MMELIIYSLLELVCKFCVATLCQSFRLWQSLYTDNQLLFQYIVGTIRKSSSKDKSIYSQFIFV